MKFQYEELGLKARYAPRINLHNRTKLENVIPISTPYVIFVDTCDACNFKCAFCPTSDSKLMKSVNRPLRVMKIELFKKLVNDMLEFPEKVKTLRMYKDGEPLLNKKISEMIEYAKSKNCCEKIDITTNASLLTENKGKELVEAGLDRINISIEGVNKEQYKNFSDVDIEFERVFENVKNFHKNKKNCEMLVKINGDTLSEKDLLKFFKIFGNYTDLIHVERILDCWPNFSFRGNLKSNKNLGIWGEEVEKELDVCPYPFYSISLNSNGTMSLCFLDWAHKLVVGDLNKESLKEIWNGKNLKNYRMMFLKGNRKEHDVCGKCGQMSHGSPDNIDSFKSDLLGKL